MGANPFRGCCEYCVLIDEENEYYRLIDGNVYTADGKKIISYLGREESFSIPEGTEYIGEMAFAYSSLRNINFANSVKEIGRFAFWGCYFESLSIPCNIRSIGEMAFCDCKYMHSLYIEEGLSKICKRAFDGCARLKRVFLPKTLCEAEEGVFDGCAIAEYQMDIFYGGSKSQWRKIDGVETFSTSKIHYKTIFGYTK